MWRHLWVAIVITTLFVKSNCDNTNRTDTVFVKFGHAEVEGGYRDRTTVKAKQNEVTTVGTTTVHVEPSTPKTNEEDTETVVFVPNNEPHVRGDEEYGGGNMRLKDIMTMKSVHDAMDEKFQEEKSEESPKEDIVFISGKNKDLEKEQEDYTRRRNNNNNQNNYRRMENTEDVISKPKLNCRNLDCNNTIQSVCGAKLVNKDWTYRLFLNDCYFRKVNCGFKYEMNRYQQVDLDRCSNKGAHSPERPFSFKPRPFRYQPEIKPEDTRRSSSSRRSMARDLNGHFCSHPCPATCTDDYDPQCAVSGTGQKRVFLNHCKLDLNSCFYGVVWHKKALSECVGGKKADMRENRGFIGWMQRVGIVDKKGRLVLE